MGSNFVKFKNVECIPVRRAFLKKIKGKYKHSKSKCREYLSLTRKMTFFKNKMLRNPIVYILINLFFSNLLRLFFSFLFDSLEIYKFILKFLKRKFKTN